MQSMTLRWLVGALLLGLLGWGCNGTGADKAGGSARRGAASIDDEAYILPPLSEFEEFPANIASDLLNKSQKAGFTLSTIRRTKAGSRQSVLAVFSGGGDPSQERVAEAFTLLGNNFADVARIVLEFPGSAGPVYFVASGKKLEQYLGKDPEETLTLDQFWETLEREVPPEPVAEAPKEGASGRRSAAN